MLNKATRVAVKERNDVSTARAIAGWLFAAMVILSPALISLHSAQAVPAPEPTPAVQPTDTPTAPDKVEREIILDVVREHRRRTSDAWRQRLADAVYEESVHAGIDPLLVASIVARESSFRSRIVSRAGAVGLMQLRPWVAREIARRTDLEWTGLETLHDPSLNVRLGVQYYKELLGRFEGDAHKALTAYNYGPSRVSRQVRAGTFLGSDYAEKIIDMYEGLSDRVDRA